MVDFISLEKINERTQEIINEIYLLAGKRSDRNWSADGKINQRIAWLKGLSFAREDILND